MNPQQCHRCQGRRVVDGKICGGQFAVKPSFCPSGKRFFSASLRSGVEVESHACIDCGLVWASTNPAVLEEFVQKHTNHNLDG
jgi:hypothetical protein